MFGILRTTLAIMVMTGHLFFESFKLGGYAVFGFYIISGYLMTLIMHESYSYTRIGQYSFAVNRFLRLYPQYWLAAIFTMVLILIIGDETVRNYNESMFLPVTYSDYFNNILMIFPSWNPSDIKPRLVPPSWALTVEILFYVLICLGISKTVLRVKIWFLLSICYVVATFIAEYSWQDRYYPVAAASLSFSIGSAIFFLSKKKNMREAFLKCRVSSLLLFALMLINCMTWIILSRLHIGKLEEVGFYINIIICALLVYSIVCGNEIFKLSRRVDKLIGDFSFPIYLLHWQSGLLVSYVMFGEVFHEFSLRGLACFGVTMIFVTILSFIFILIIDKPIQHIRAKIKASKALKLTLKFKTNNV